ELLLELFDEFGIESLGAAVFDASGHVIGAARRLSRRSDLAALAAAETGGGLDSIALDLRDDPFDRATRHELDDGEGHEHDAQQRRDHEQDALEDVDAHFHPSP